MPMTGAGLPKPGGFTPTCTASTNWLARATNVTLTADKTHYDDLLCGLNTDGIGCSNTLDALYIYMAVDVSTAKLNLCSSSFAITSHGTNIDTSGFAQYVGFTGNSSDRYLDTGLDPSLGGTFYSQNSAAFGTCISTSNTGNLVEMGQNVGGDGSRLIAAFGGTIGIFEINQNSQDTPSNTLVAGLWDLSRTAASVNTYYLGTSTVGTGTVASRLPTSATFFILAENSSGSPATFTSNTHLGSFVGKGLNGTQAGNLRSRMNTFAMAYSKSC